MYNHDKRKFARLGGCVMLLLSALVLLAGSLPVVRLELAGTRSEWFLQGSITAELETPTGELRTTPATLLQAVRHWRALREIAALQNLEAEIRETEAALASADGQARDALQAELDSLRAERDGALPPGREEELRALAASGALDELLCIWDGYIRVAPAGEAPAADASGDELMRYGALLLYLAFAACFPIFAAVWLMARAVYLLVHYRKLGEQELRRLSALRVCFGYVLANLLLLLLFAVWGLRPGYNGAALGWLAAVTALACLAHVLCRYEYRAEPREGFWLRQGLRALCFAGAVTAAWGFVSLGLPFLVQTQSPSPASVSGRLALLLSMAVAALLFGLALAAACALARWKPVPTHGAVAALPAVASGVLVLALAAVPLCYGTGNAQKQAQVTADGGFCVLWDAHRVEGTAANSRYRSLLEEERSLTAALEQKNMAIANSHGEAVLELIAEKDALESRLCGLQADLQALDTHQRLDLALCLIGALALLGGWLAVLFSGRAAGRPAAG